MHNPVIFLYQSEIYPQFVGDNGKKTAKIGVVVNEVIHQVNFKFTLRITDLRIFFVSPEP